MRRFEPRKSETARAQSTPARASFWTFDFFIRILLFESNLRNGDSAALPIPKESGRHTPARKAGRSSLASSHAGTRLPIAVIQDRRRSPLSATARPWMPSAHILPPKNSNKKGALIRAPKENHPNYFPTLALSKSGYGSKVNPSSQPVHTSSPGVFCFSGSIIIPQPGGVKSRSHPDPSGGRTRPTAPPRRTGAARWAAGPTGAPDGRTENRRRAAPGAGRTWTG